MVIPEAERSLNSLKDMKEMARRNTRRVGRQGLMRDRLLVKETSRTRKEEQFTIEDKSKAQMSGKEVDYEILDRKYPIKEWKIECLGIKPQDDKAEHLEEINQNVVIRGNGQKRYFSTLMRVLSIFDRDDCMLCINWLWTDIKDWNIVSWKLHGSSGVHTLVTEAGLVIHMLVEKKYPLRKKVLDAPSTSIPSSQEQEHSLIISQGFEESPKTPTFHDDPLNESPNEDSTSQGSSSNIRQIHTPFEHLGRWTKDHPIANVIGDPSRSVRVFAAAMQHARY
ncbi:hypothetical protein Tco_1202252 [Tanacetum coccineum]